MEALVRPATEATPLPPPQTPDTPKNYVGLVGMAGYAAWVKPILEIAPKIFPDYAVALMQIKERRDMLRQADIAGPMGRTAGWSPTRNFKIAFEMPYEASLLFKAAFGPDALRQPKVQKLIRQNHPEFVVSIRR